MAKEILYEKVDGIGTLLINRPEARNALNRAAQDQFAQVIASASEDPSLRVLIISGVGENAFASGADIKELIGKTTKSDAIRLNQVIWTALGAMTQLSCPVIGAVNGDAIGGGCEILTARDLRLASKQARFRFAQVSVGLTTGWGGLERLIRLVGLSHASQLLLTSKMIDAMDAYGIGFIHSFTEGNVAEDASRIAKDLSIFPPSALRYMKQLLWAVGSDESREFKAVESKLFLELWQAPDCFEAMSAFLDKRKPKFGS